MHTPVILDGTPTASEAREYLGKALGAALREAARDPQRMLPLWQAFSCGDPVRADSLIASLSGDAVAAAQAFGLLTGIDVGEQQPWLRATVCVVPVAIAGELVWVASDFPWYDAEPEAVSGPGAATQTLRALVPQRRYPRILDLGSGSGALGVALVEDGGTLDAIDLNPRAVGFTELTAALNAVDVHAGVGDLLAVAGGPYDLIVCNPPFVLGRPTERTIFRDAEDDAAYAGLAHLLHPRLALGGIGVYLTNWVYGPELPDPLSELTDDLQTIDGADILIVERALVTVADYIGVWTDDDDLAQRWADGLAADGVTHVGTGAVVVRRREGEAAVEVSRPYDLPQEDLADAIEAWLDAQEVAHDL